MSSDIRGRALKPGLINPVFALRKVYATEAIAKHDIVVVTGIVGDTAGGAVAKVAKASNATTALGRGTLLMAKHAIASGAYGHAAVTGVNSTFATTGSTIGDPVYLSTAGASTLTATGYRRRVGTVLIVGAAGTGAYLFDPTSLDAEKQFITGTATVANGAATATIAAATLGGSYGGSPAFATLMEADGTLVIRHAVWSTNDLVITLSGNATDDRTVSYMVVV